MRLLAGWAGVLAVLTALVVEVGARAVVAGEAGRAELPLRSAERVAPDSPVAESAEVAPQRQAEGLRGGFQPGAGQEKRWAYSAAKVCGIQATLFWCQVLSESGGKHWGEDGRVLQSGSGAWGMAQAKVGTARDLSPYLDVMNPWDNAVIGACHLRSLMDKYGRTEVALQAYHAGEARVERGGVGERSREYARGVLECVKEEEK